MWLEIVLSGIVVFAAHAIKTVTGFGCAVFSFPFIAAIFGVHDAKVLLVVISWILSAYLTITGFRHIQFKTLVIIGCLTGLGMPLGIYIFNSFSGDTLKILLGIFMVAASAIQLKMLFFGSARKRTLPEPIYYFLLICAGIIHGAFATGGPLVVLYAARKLTEKAHFRSTLSLFWVIMNTALFFFDPTFSPLIHDLKGVLSGSGIVTGQISIILWMLPYLVAGIVTGEIIYTRVNAAMFGKIVFSLLLATGFFLIAGP